MPISDQHQNHITRKLQLAARLVEDYYDGQLDRSEWDLNEVFTSITDEDLTEYSDFKHLTVAELANVQTSIDAVVAALGTVPAGLIANLIKARP